jgi:very-short-patch-repair endonuclease
LKKSEEQVSLAREFRQQQTDAERALWTKLKKQGNGRREVPKAAAYRSIYC